jgi:hypothetical protein
MNRTDVSKRGESKRTGPSNPVFILQQNLPLFPLYLKDMPKLFDLAREKLSIDRFELEL